MTKKAKAAPVKAPEQTKVEKATKAHATATTAEALQEALRGLTPAEVHAVIAARAQSRAEERKRAK